MREASLEFMLKTNRLNESRTRHSFSIHVEIIPEMLSAKIFSVTLEWVETDYHLLPVAADYGAMANR